MGNLREAIRAQSRDVWERSPQDQEKFWVKYLRDFISLIGLLIALIVTLSITSVAGSAQQMIISALHLNSIEWLKPTWRLIGPGDFHLSQLSAFLLDLLAVAAPPSAQKSPDSRNISGCYWF